MKYKVNKSSQWPAPGIYLDIPAEQYHELRGFSKSWMDKLRDSPAHLFDSIHGAPSAPTESQKIGTAVHCLALEPDRFKERYAMGPDVDGRSKEYKEFKKISESKGKTVLSVKDFNWCKAISEGVRSHPKIAPLFKKDHWVEPSLVWDIDGYVCKCRPDFVALEDRIIVDVKTTMATGPYGFAREIAKHHYYTQASWYLDGVFRCTGDYFMSFWLAAAEKKRPFLSAVYSIDLASKAQLVGCEESVKYFKSYTECMKKGEWPGYSKEVMPVELPEWVAMPEGIEESIEEPFE